MGWLILLVLIGIGVAALRLLGARRGLLTASAAALLLGGAGYALQGRPGLPSSPAAGSDGRGVIPLTEARHAFYGNFTPVESWLRMSEALARTGNTEDAVGILQNAAHRYPGDPQLWIGLGNALVDHSRGLTPPAELAYRRAAELSPGYPAPAFFYGLALARSGDRENSLRLWREVLAKAPGDATWRPLLENGIAALSAPAGPARGQSPPAASPQPASP